MAAKAWTEGLVSGDAAEGCDGSLGLLDHDAAGQGALQLVGSSSRPSLTKRPTGSDRSICFHMGVVLTRRAGGRAASKWAG
jgi:hypothetical protein